ncbi:MAG: hypothetical protein AABY63_02100, partial [candidate division NC10 bacterium]
HPHVSSVFDRGETAAPIREGRAIREVLSLQPHGLGMTTHLWKDRRGVAKAGSAKVVAEARSEGISRDTV